MYLLVTESAPANLSYPYVDGQLAAGDTFEVDDEKGEQLLDVHDYLEEAIDVEGGEVDDRNEGDDAQLEESTYEELRELASEYDISGRSEMDKAELIDALRDYTEE